MHETAVRRLDPSLLLLFQEVYRGGKLAGAAKRLNLSPSAASHGLTRLRLALGDDLFERLPHGMRPTQRAHALAPRITAVLEALGDLCVPQPAFDPANSDRRFRLSALDSTASLLLPDLIGHIRRLAPDVVLTTQALPRDAMAAAVLDGRIDLGLGHLWKATPGLRITPLGEETYAVVRRTAFDAAPTLEDYLAERHLLVSQDGEPSGIVDFTLRRLGARRTVAATAPNFFVALAVAARTDLMLTLPRRFAEKWADAFGLAVAAPPIAVRSFSPSLISADRIDRDPGAMWLHEALLECAAGLYQHSRGFGVDSSSA